MKLMQIYTDETAYHGDRKVFEIVAERARDSRLGGATVLQATIGFGRSAHMHRRHILESERSVVIEIVDEEARLRRFLADILDLKGIGLMTLESVEVVGGDAGPASTGGDATAPVDPDPNVGDATPASHIEIGDEHAA